jgi:hemoglobin
LNRVVVIPGVEAGVTEAMIADVVHAFYAKVRRDPELGPIFNGRIGERWDAHLAKLCDFWSSVLLMTGRFKGQPMVVHARLDEAGAEHFQRWLRMFHETVDEVCPGPPAELFKAKSAMIAQSLQFGMAAARGQPPGAALQPR